MFIKIYRPDYLKCVQNKQEVILYQTTIIMHFFSCKMWTQRYKESFEKERHKTSSDTQNKKEAYTVQGALFLDERELPHNHQVYCTVASSLRWMQIMPNTDFCRCCTGITLLKDGMNWVIEIEAEKNIHTVRVNALQSWGAKDYCRVGNFFAWSIRRAIQLRVGNAE